MNKAVDQLEWSAEQLFKKSGLQLAYSVHVDFIRSKSWVHYYTRETLNLYETFHYFYYRKVMPSSSWRCEFALRRLSTL